MLDFGLPELFVIMVVAVFVIGPKEIPEFMRALGRLVRRLQYMRFAATRQFDDFMKDHDLEELRSGAEMPVIEKDKDDSNDAEKY